MKLGLWADIHEHTEHLGQAIALTLETLLRRITGHIPHHVRFIEEKRRALSKEK